MILSELLNDLAKKAGIPEDDAALKSLLSNAELSKVSVDAKIKEAIQGNLYTIDAALASPKVSEELRKKVKSEILNGVDSGLEAMMEKVGLDPDSISEVKKGETTYKRIASLTEKLTKLSEKKTPSNDKDKDALTQQINALKAEIAQEKQNFTAQLKAEQEKFASREQDMAFEHFLGQFDYANDGAGNPDVKRANILATKTLLNERAAREGVKYVYENGGWKLVKSDGTDYYDPKNNTKVEFKQFVEQGVAPLLKVSDPNAGKGAGAGQGGGGGEPKFVGRSNGRDLASIEAEIAGK